MVINIIILIALVTAALWTAMTTRLLRSAVGLAITSAILSILIFRLSSPIAAVFELSVCAGLIFAIFIISITVTQRVTPEAFETRKKERMTKFWPLPIIVIIVAVVLTQIHFQTTFNLPAQTTPNDVKIILWNLRHLDLLGQIVILLTGAFGVVILFKEWKND
jgi:NADH-quinone oxidoreductase subunit J